MSRAPRPIPTTLATLLVWGVLVSAFGVLAVAGLGPHLGLYRLETVLSGSMRPEFSPGDVIVVTPHPLSDVRVGDVITYEAPIPGHPTITHRVIEVVRGGGHPVIRTKGDANTAPDPWTARLGDGPLWRLHTVIPHAGSAIRLLREPHLRWMLVLALPLLLAIIWLRAIWAPAGEPVPGADHRSPWLSRKRG
jgi:signal peptidase